MKTPKNETLSEAIITDFRKKISNLETTIAIYENDINRALQSLKEKYNVDSIEEALAKAESINQEMAALEISKGALLSEIKETMSKYQD